MSSPEGKPVTNEDRQAILKRLERFSRLTDSAVRIPFTRISVGIEPVIGLIPVVGDFAGLLISGYVLAEAQRAGASRRVKAHMIKNFLIDALVGSVPVLGDAFDVMYKANVRNTRLLKEDLERQFGVEQSGPLRFSPGKTTTDADAS
ncbi:protein of unknown function [Marinobacter daqiaonensis]|uniref:DUF4112 domain-containing protein n=1 Tax=Marinobacter daqiaonensis TaxID=650891 RepID=A0A1I6HHD4_9GAMM|nr:DUF4112 domain-containing protein [Marinobacter daqiaonensis]SFR53905.1 protein of unknown function [Marinobacter daqiaonensis]